MRIVREIKRRKQEQLILHENERVLQQREVSGGKWMRGVGLLWSAKEAFGSFLI